MRIAFVHPAAPGNEGTGAVQTATLLVRRLAERGHAVTVLCRREPTGDPDLAVETLDVSGAPYHTATLLNRSLERRARDGTLDDYDVVHSYLPSSIPGMATIGAETPARTVVTLNAYGGVCPKNDLRYMDRTACRERGVLRCVACSVATSPGSEQHGALYRSASRLGNVFQIERGLSRLGAIDRFHALSDHVRETYAAFEFPDERIATIPPPVDEQFVRDHTSAFTPPYRLLYVGYLERQKGVDRLIPVLDRVRAAGVDAELTVVGDGGRRSRLEQQAVEYELETATRFTGRVPNASLPDMYTEHDLFLYPGAWDEPWGRVFLEALATGTPIVSSDVGAAADIVGDAGIVTPSSVDELAAGVVSALRDRDLQDLSTAGHAQIEGYRPDTVVTRLEALYEAVLDG